MLFDRRFAFLGLLAFSVGCSNMPDDGLQFTEVSQSQPIAVEDVSDLRFTDEEGKEVKLADIMTGDYLVLVFTRGWYGGVCFYCGSQTSRWAYRADELKPYGAQLAVVFPTESEEDAVKISELRSRIKGGDIPNESVPYPVLLDINLESVDKLGIRGDLAKPSTFIVDRQGRVVFAHVGESVGERPSVDSILKQLAKLEKQQT